MAKQVFKLSLKGFLSYLQQDYGIQHALKRLKDLEEDHCRLYADREFKDYDATKQLRVEVQQKAKEEERKLKEALLDCFADWCLEGLQTGTVVIYKSK